MKIYTKTGDDGTTGLFGGKRVAKFSARIEAYGTVDELNAVIGVALTHDLHEKVSEPLLHISSLLFTVGSDLATPQDASQKSFVPAITEEHVDFLEKWIDAYQEHLPALRNFILPGGHTTVSYCHLARVVCRRAERITVHLSEVSYVDEMAIRYLNRLSDYLFTLSRKIAQDLGVEEYKWIPRVNL